MWLHYEQNKIVLHFPPYLVCKARFSLELWWEQNTKIVGVGGGKDWKGSSVITFRRKMSGESPSSNNSGSKREVLNDFASSQLWQAEWKSCYGGLTSDLKNESLRNGLNQSQIKSNYCLMILSISLGILDFIAPINSTFGDCIVSSFSAKQTRSVCLGKAWKAFQEWGVVQVRWISTLSYAG